MDMQSNALLDTSEIHVRLRSPHIFFWIGIISLFILPSVADPFIPEFKGSVFSVWFKSNIETLIHAQAIAFVALVSVLCV